MAWTAPMTFVSGAVLTAAQLNTHLRDNLNETAPAKATAPSGDGRFFVSTAANAIAERRITGAEIITQESTTSTAYVDLLTIGPVVTVTTGTRAIVILTTRCFGSIAPMTNFMGYAVSGATALTAIDNEALHFQSDSNNHTGRQSCVSFVALNAGSHTFTAKYRVSGSTGNFSDRQLLVIPL